MKSDQKNCQLVETFAKNVRTLRLKEKLSQEALAELAGVHRTYVGMLERGEKNVTIYNIEKIAKALQVEPSILLLKELSPEKTAIPLPHCEESSETKNSA